MKHLLMINKEYTVAHAKIALSHGYSIHSLPVTLHPFRGGSQMPDIPSLDEFAGKEYDAVCVDHPALAIRCLLAGFAVVSFENDSEGRPLHLHRYKIDWETCDHVDLTHTSRSPNR